MSTSEDDPIDGSFSFRVVPEHSDPHRIVPIDVEVSCSGLTISTIEDDRTQRTVTAIEWIELLELNRLGNEIRELNQEIKELREEIQFIREDGNIIRFPR